ncbi:hypothetical protein [Streptomyces sp. NPDC086010]|uniref:hypothetical protein n=1 Tax=Streptomyces sp. NPDC086010 TaxID=3365745 RepID=UPI0037D13130
MAQNLGVRDLTSVSLGLNGNVNAKKPGSKHRFSAFSPTEPLRLRIATVVAVITVGVGTASWIRSPPDEPPHQGRLAALAAGI